MASPSPIRRALVSGLTVSILSGAVLLRLSKPWLIPWLHSLPPSTAIATMLIGVAAYIGVISAIVFRAQTRKR